DTPGDAGKAARVAEGFEVEQNHVGVRVFFPVLEEVVARDIRLVTDTYKCREAQVEAASGGQDRQTQSAALGGHSYSSRRRKERREGCVKSNSRIGVEQPHAVGADHAHAVATHFLN